MDAVPLAGLIDKVKEVAGLMPILKKVNARQVNLEMEINRFISRSEEEFLYKDQLTVDFGEFQRDIVGMVQEFLNNFQEDIKKEISNYATEESVVKRLAAKATSSEYGAMLRDFRGIQYDLNPLLDRKRVLTEFIRKVQNFEDEESEI